MDGERLGHYRIVDKLGAGGMGEVYRAHDDRLDRDVAIKRLRPASFSDATARTRLLREARAAAALNHSNICTVYDVGEVDGQAYIAMELVDGQTLSARSNGQALPFDDVIHCGRQIADALAHAHAHQIVHRDLKPANVVITRDGRIKVLDFGLAKRMPASETDAGTTADGTLTAPGAVAGTFAYMAPEQFRGAPANARSDIWALGVVLYELATGRRPFTGQSSFELSAGILHQPAASIPSTVPVALRGIIERCLEKQPDRRYQSAAEVRSALDAIAAGTQTSWPIHAGVSRHPWLVAAIIAIAAVLLGVMNAGWIRRLATGRAPGVQSIAVLPLENLSGDAAQEYFADGMTEVLSTDLARLTGLRRVIARSSVIRYKRTQMPVADIARELNVDALLTGSILRAGNRVSITVQLLDPVSGGQLWSNRYERDLQDVLVLRNEIVAAIVGEINAQLSPGEQARLASARAVNPEAFEAYLKGRFEWFKQTREGFDLAERYYQQAIDKDPEYALGHAGLASVWFMRSDVGFAPPSETSPKARASMSRAVDLDDSVADLHVQLANQKCALEWDWAGAEREYRRALELNPNLADAHFYYGHLLLVLKRIGESNRLMERGLELDPLNDFHRSFYGWHLNYLGRYDDAIPIFEKLLATGGPNRASSYLGLWGAYYRKGLYSQALSSAQQYFVATGDREFAEILETGRDRREYAESMKRAGDMMVVRSRERYVPAIRIARMFAHAGATESALDWLERAYDNRESTLMRLGVFWDWLDLHREPRFQALLRRVNLP